MRKLLLSFTCIIGLLGGASTNLSAQAYKRVVLQAFWWDYWNNNYPNAWANYLADLAPRLKAMGIDAVWIPGDVKQKGLNSVGYSPFDHYDLGEKLQRSEANGGVTYRTRMGTKDELLRMIAVLHANGIEVISDVVVNHMDGAGPAQGPGGQDNGSTSMFTNNGYKNFRYACYETPANFTLPNFAATDDQNQNDYWSRKGRWPKNSPNFHLHAGHWDSNSDMAAPNWGPDVCYGGEEANASDGFGPSSNISGAGTYNPSQPAAYMRTEATNWMKWYKKQTDVDGYRFDAVKHFDYNLQESLMWNSMYGVGDWNGDQEQFNVGEFVGDLNWYSNKMKVLGGNDLRIGVMDFQLRAGLKGIVAGGGNHYMGDLPGSQISSAFRMHQYPSKKVHRSCNFVNSHDTFRPILNGAGNYTGWDSGNELTEHIDPYDPRLSNAYATCIAMDGNTIVYFEDLFDIGGSGNRYTHIPSDAVSLPARQDVANMIWAHHNLYMKDSDYNVRWQDGDYLVIERTNKAMIGINDNWNTWRGQWVATSIAAGTVLKDYSGANGNSTNTVQPGNCSGGGGPNCVYINTPPVDSVLNTAGRKGYSIWAPVGQDGNNALGYANPITTQEWEMADDLGDSHCSSLGYGGALPDNSTRQRVVGKIFVAGGTTITYSLYPELAGSDHNIAFFNLSGSKIGSSYGPGNISGSLVAPQTGWYVVKIWSSFETYAKHNASVKISYAAPATIDAQGTPATSDVTKSIWTGNSPTGTADWFDCRNWEEGRIPNENVDVIIPSYAKPYPAGSSIGGSSITIRSVTIEDGAKMPLDANFNLYIKRNFDNFNTSATVPTSMMGKVILEGTQLQTIRGYNRFNGLEINNSLNVKLLGNCEVSSYFNFVNGKMLLDNFNMKMLGNAAINGASATKYFVTKDDKASTSGFLIRQVLGNSSYVEFPIGVLANRTPATLQHSGTNNYYFKVRVFSNIFAQGGAGTQMNGDQWVNRTWEIKPEPTTYFVNANVILVWDGFEQGLGFLKPLAKIAKNTGAGAWTAITAPNVVNGTGPYSAQANNISNFSFFSITSEAILPLEWLSFDAKLINDHAVELTWETAQEHEVAAFEVQRSENGSQFERIAAVPAKGFGKYNYTDVDFPPTSDVIYYRLKEVTTNGAEGEYSIVKSLKIRKKSIDIQCTPNPSIGMAPQVILNVEEASLYQVRLMDMSGKLLYSQEYDAQKGDNTLILGHITLPAGSYYLEVANEKINEKSVLIII